MMKLLRLVGLVLVASAAFAVEVRAANYFWILPGNSTGAWNSPASWNPVGVPDSLDSTFFNSSSASLHAIVVTDVIGGDDFVVQRGLYRLTHSSEPNWEFRMLQRTDMFRIGTSLAGPARLEVVDGVFTMYPELEVGVLAGSDGTLVMTDTQWLYDDALLIPGDSPRDIDIGVDGGTGLFELRGDANFVGENNPTYVGSGADSSGTWRVLDDSAAEAATISVGEAGGSGTIDVQGSLVVNATSRIGSTGGFGRVNVEQGGYWYGGGVLGVSVNDNGVIYVAGVDLPIGADIKSLAENTMTVVKSGGVITIDNAGEYRTNQIAIQSGGDVNLLAGGKLVTTSTGFQATNLNDFDWSGGALEFVGDDLEVTTATSAKAALGSSVTVGSGRALLATTRVRQGGVLTVFGNAVVEGHSGSISQGASVTLSGSDARWNVLGAEFVGDFQEFSMSGAGSDLSILAGADFFTDTARVQNESAIVLDGAGSTWTGRSVEFGDSSPGLPPGRLAVQNGASLILSQSLSLDNGFQVTMNQGSISVSGLTVTDGGSIAPAVGALVPGNVTVANDVLVRGGSITLFGFGSALVASRAVNVRDGGVLNAYINGGAQTNVTISDAGSSWTTPNVAATVLGSTTSGLGRIRSLTLNAGAVANLAAGVSYDAGAVDGLTMAGGTLNAPTFHAGGVGVAGRGTINANYTGSGAIVPNGPLTIGNIGSTAGFATTGATIVFANTLTLNDADAAELGTSTVIGIAATPGTILAANGLALSPGDALSGNGFVNTPNVSGKPLVNNGAINGATTTERITLPGYVTGAGVVQNVTFAGTYSPGNSPATINASNVTFAVTSELIMEIAGTTPGSGHDKIIDTGTLAVGGRLRVVLANGFNPFLGNTFDLFDFAALIGTFSEISLPALNPGLVWNTSQLYAQGRLSVALPPILEADFDEDGDVDGFDLAIWQGGLGSFNEGGAAHDEGDATGEGTVDGRDFLVWQRQFGSMPVLAVASPTTAAVPEPQSAALAAVMLSSLLLTRRRTSDNRRR